MTPADRDPTLYGRSFADVYDEWYSESFDTDATVAAISRLAQGGAVLELGAGTGRLALPLSNLGADVIALDASDEMLRRLRDRDRLGRVTTVVADMAVFGDLADVRDRRFGAVVCACSSILNLPDEGSIGRCLAAATTVLAPDGVVVIEAIVPADDVPVSTLSPARVRSDAAVFVETRFDPRTRRVSGSHIEVTDGEITTRPWSVVFVDVDRFDVLAAAAGLRLRERWSDWSGSPFDDDSGSHVSIYERDA